MEHLKLSFLIGFILIMTLFIFGCEYSIDNEAVEIIEDNDSLEEKVFTNDKDVDNDKKVDVPSLWRFDGFRVVFYFKFVA